MTVFNFELLNVPFAVNAISSEVAPFPDYQRGLGIAFDQTDGKPEMKGLNGLFQSITTSILYLKQRGIAEWDSTLEYIANSSWVMQNGKLYKAIRNNTNKSPATSQLDWAVWASVSDISVSTNGNLKKTVATDGSGSITLEVPTASDSQRGAVRKATSLEVVNRSNVNAYISPNDVGQTFSGDFSDNGWCRLPNGLILQWGTVDYSSAPQETDVVVNFPVQFSSACLNVQLTRKINSSASLSQNDGGILFISASRFNFNANLAYFSNESAFVRGFTWFAIGY